MRILKVNRVWVKFYILVNLIIFLTACSGDRQTPLISGKPIEVLSITKDISDDSFIPEYTGGNNGTVTYTSSDPLIADINEITGEISLLSTGVVAITLNEHASGIYKAQQASFALTVVSGITANIGVVHTGQSLAVGGYGDDIAEGVYSPFFPNKTFMFSPKPVGAGYESLSEIPVELTEINKVTIGHSLANHIAKNISTSILFHGHARGGQKYSELKKGGTSGVYERLLQQINDAKINFPGIEYKAITVIHGEGDGVINNANYQNNLDEWQRDLNLDIKKITGQSQNIPMFISQTSTAGGFDFNGGIADTNFPSPLHQLDASITNDNIILVAPKYFLTYYDRAHITNLSQRILGEYFAVAIEQGVNYEPLRPSKIIGAGNKVTITYVGNVGNLVFDISSILEIKNYGFDYMDDNDAKIYSVDIIDNKVVITLDKNIGDNAFVSYAYHNGSGGGGSQKRGQGDRGNLRDSNPKRSIYDDKYYLYNWSVIFKKQVMPPIAEELIL